MSIEKGPNALNDPKIIIRKIYFCLSTIKVLDFYAKITAGVGINGK
jgi:hypothetical protein